MVWAGVSFNGKTELHFFNGPVNAVTYRDDVLAQMVLPFLQANPNVNILQQDNARAHTARVVRTYLQNHNVNVLPWPALSPDMAPIEHVWDELGRRVAARPQHPNNLQELRQALTEEWRNMPQNAIQRIINSIVADV